MEKQKRQPVGAGVFNLERVMGLEPTISCLGSKRSTTELHPHKQGVFYTMFRVSSIIISENAPNPEKVQGGEEANQHRVLDPWRQVDLPSTALKAAVQPAQKKISRGMIDGKA